MVIFQSKWGISHQFEIGLYTPELYYSPRERTFISHHVEIHPDEWILLTVLIILYLYTLTVCTGIIHGSCIHRELNCIHRNTVVPKSLMKGSSHQLLLYRQNWTFTSTVYTVNKNCIHWLYIVKLYTLYLNTLMITSYTVQSSQFPAKMNEWIMNDCFPLWLLPTQRHVEHLSPIQLFL